MDTNLIYVAALASAAYAVVHFATREPGSVGLRQRFRDWREEKFNWVWKGSADARGATDGWADDMHDWVERDKASGGSSVAARAAWDALGVDTAPWPVIASPVDVEATAQEPIAVHHIAHVHILTPAQMEEARWAAEWARVDDILEHDCRRSDSVLFAYEGVREEYDRINRQVEAGFASALREDAASIARMLVMIEAHLAVAETTVELMEV